MGEKHLEKCYPVLGGLFGAPCATIPNNGYVENGAVVNVIRNWLQTHEEAQVMMASVLVIVALWWLVRTIMTLFISLICPFLVVFLAVICVPQLRAPLLGQNYPMLANLLKTILLKLAENINT